MKIWRTCSALLIAVAFSAGAADSAEHSLSLGLDYTFAEICPSSNWIGYCKESRWGLAAGYEAAWQVGPTVDLGFGLEYLFPHNYGWAGDRSYLSVFASSRWRIAGPETKLYLLARFGWTLHDYDYGVKHTDLEGSAMYGAGTGYQVTEHWSGELVFTKIVESISYRRGGPPPLFENELLSLRVRYTF